MVTVRDVARYAGVSIGTVDRVLHNRGRVAAETEARVNEALSALNYQPNLHARNLTQSRTLVVSVLSPAPDLDPDLDRGYWRLPLSGIDRALRRFTPNNVEVRRVWFDRHNEKSFMEALQEMEAPDGLLVAPVVSRDAQRALGRFIHAHGIPTVTFDSQLAERSATDSSGAIDEAAGNRGTGTESAEPQAGLAFVGQNPYQGGLTAGRLSSLFAQGGSNFASVTLGSADAHLIERARGFREYWEAGGTEAKVHEILLDDRDEAAYVRDLRQQLQPLVDELNAVFVTNAASETFIAATETLQRSRRIPLVGYDLLPQNARLVREGRIDAIISQKPEQQGYEAMSILLQYIIYGKPMPSETLMPVEIILKENLVSFASG
ncbi:MAG: LacI family DNA-binding transcriptional regulator [bacterium]